MPLTLLYIANSVILINKRSRYIFIDKTHIKYSEVTKSFGAKIKMMNSLDTSSHLQLNADKGDDSHNNIPMSFSNCKILLTKCYFPILCLTSSYFIQYSCLTSFADVFATRLEAQYEVENTIQHNTYIILAF